MATIEDKSHTKKVQVDQVTRAAEVDQALEVDQVPVVDLNQAAMDQAVEKGQLPVEGQVSVIFFVLG